MKLNEEALKLLNNLAMIKFFEDAKEKYHQIIESTSYTQDELRTDCYLMLRSINELKNTLSEYAKFGEIKEVPQVKRLKPLD